MKLKSDNEKETYWGKIQGHFKMIKDTAPI